MKLLLDQGLPRSSATLLRDAGIDAVHTGDIRIERLRANACAELLILLLNDWQDELESGAMLTVQPGRVRIHHLPILP